MRRVVVVGSGGSGKSTFSKELGSITGLPVIHLDREYWRPGWEETPREEWAIRVAEMLGGERWIMDGNFGGTRKIRMWAADTIIFLDLPRCVCLYRILKRTVKYYGRSRPDMTDGCNERFDIKFLGWVWSYKNRSRKRLLAELDSIGDKRVIILKNQRQVSEFLSARQSQSVSDIQKSEYTISTDQSRLDVGLIHTFLSEESYWARERTEEQTRTAIENSICFGLYNGDKQIGFARVVSDKATFAYVGDVFVLSEYRGQGLSKWLMQEIVDHPELQGLRRWVLATRDAHGLYEQFEFAPLRHPDRWMEKTAPNAY